MPDPRTPLHEWERIDDDKNPGYPTNAQKVQTYRMRVPGGWVYRCERSGSAALTPAITFVPDPTPV